MKNMSSFLIIVFFIGLFSSEYGRSLELQRGNCERPYFQEHYLQLITDERAISEAFNKMVRNSGTSDVTNCRVLFPVDENGKPAWGVRYISFDMRWYCNDYVNGIKVPELHQEGLWIEYDKKLVGSQESRKVISYMVCRTPESCRRMGIPFHE